ncbi:MAG TPA: response regulator [Caldilineae bacterium]|nr:response regulator [Caldilineae bacterium]
MAKTILVVDDEPDVQQLLNLILTRAGYQVSTANDGIEALSEVGRTPPDLILLDIMMPGMDGYEVLQRLRSDPATAHIPVIILSAKGDVQDRVKGLRLGADDYIPKPADPNELIARVEAVLARVQRATLAPRGHVIAFLGAKGGVGTTTVALNVGAVIAQNQRVILAELRREPGSAAILLGLRPRRTLGDLMAAGEPPDRQAVEATLIEHACGLRLLAAPADVLEFPPLEPAFCEALLEHLVYSAQFILLDLALDAFFIEPLLPKAETVVLITNADPASIHNTRVLIDLAERHNLTGERCRVVLVNRAQGMGMSITTLANKLDYPVQAAIPYAWDACIASAARGLPLVLHYPDNLASLTLTELASRLTGIEIGELGALHTLPSGSGQGPRETGGGLFTRMRRSNRS